MASHTRFSSTRAAVLALLSATTAAVANAHILLPFSRDEAKTAHQLSARADSQAVPVFSNSFAYVVNASIGTPPQHVSLVISPSIGDTFMPDASSTMCSPETRYRYCSDYEPYEYANGTIYTPRPYDPTKWGDAPGTPCKNGKVTTPSRCKWGSYNQSLSSTYLPANARYSNFDPNYLHPRVASGTNITDTLMVGDIEMEDYPMGVVSSSSATWWIGVLGLGYNSTTSSTSYSSSSYAENWSGSYVNFMDRLVRSGKIKSQAYSIYLDNPEGTSGGLLFGAVDQSRYTGDLVRLSARNTYVYDRTFGTTLHSINGTNSTDSAMASFKSNDFPLDVTIGVGELYSYLPNLLADRIAEMAGASFDEDLSQFTIPCDAAKTSKAKFRFEIGGSGGPVLQVEVPDLVIPAGVYIPGMRSYRNTYDYLASNNTCLFGVQKYSSSSSSSSSYSSSNSGYYNIGSSLLRRSYLVFDLANQEVAVAAVKFPSGSERLDPKILTFDSQGITAPGSKAFQDVCDTYTSRSYGCNSNSNDGSRSSRYTPPEDESHWQKVAIGISVPFGALFIVGVVAGIVICSRLHKEKKAKDKGVGKEDTDVESQAGADADGVTRPAMAATRGGGGFRASQGPLPAIEERPETAASVKQQESAPQLPALSLTPPPPEPTEASDRNSVAVSALSEDATTAPAPAAATTATSAVEDKGKGKELDHSA